MLNGWRVITEQTGFSVNTIKKLMKEDAFPVRYIGSHPFTTKAAIETWFQAHLKKPVKPP
jgi:predicted DNA-binding transcriptional regulator AlpA